MFFSNRMTDKRIADSLFLNVFPVFFMELTRCRGHTITQLFSRSSFGKISTQDLQIFESGEGCENDSWTWEIRWLESSLPYRNRSFGTRFHSNRSVDLEQSETSNSSDSIALPSKNIFNVFFIVPPGDSQNSSLDMAKIRPSCRRPMTILPFGGSISPPRTEPLMIMSLPHRSRYRGMI